MKPTLMNRLAVGLMGLGMACAVMAQQTPQGQEQRERTGEVVTGRAGTATERQTQLRAGLPESMERGQIAETVRERVQTFEQLRTAYLEQHRKMLQELKGTSAEGERERIRERIRERRQEWADVARQIREQARERVEGLREALPNHGELLDQAKDQAREQVRQGLETARERVRRGVE
jgi:hypothetical protein